MDALKFLQVSKRARMLLVALILSASHAGAEEDQGPWIVPTEQCRGYWFVQIELNEEKHGKGKILNLIYDTGASSTYVDSSALERLTGRVFDQGARISLVNASAGDVRFRKLPARIHDLGHLSMAIGRPVDGILGVDAFKQFLLTLDPQTAQMSLTRGNLPRPDGETIFSSRGPDNRPWLKVKIAGKRERLLVDSGAARTGISINDIERLPLQDPARVFSSAVRLTRVEQHSAARLDGSFSLAGQIFEQPIVEGVPGTQLLGGEILRHFVMTLDQRKRRLSLRAIETDAIPPQPLYELGLGYRPTDEGLLITEVFTNTPADIAGLQSDDLITAIDGSRPDLRGCKSSDQDGRQVALTVMRNGSTVAKTLVMKPVIAAP